MDIIFQPYEPRPIRFQAVQHLKDWKLKVYTISADHTSVPQEAINAARNFTSGVLSSVRDQSHYHTGYMIVHKAREAYFYLVGWWTGENMLCQEVKMAPLNNPEQIKPLDNTAIIACVWELEVIDFERKSWMKHLLKSTRPDINNYLAENIDTTI
jgi:hypothetical protein